MAVRTLIFLIIQFGLAATCYSSVVKNSVSKDYHKQINGTNLYFHVKTYDKSKPYFLYLHGGPGGSSVGGRTVLEMLGFAKNIIFLDQRGCGKSDRNVSKETFTFENLIRDIDGVLNELKVSKVIIVGYSWGGAYGSLYANKRPGRVKGVVLVDSLVSWKQAWGNFYTYAPQYALDHISLLTKILNKSNLLINEKERLDSFCGFMHKYYSRKKNTHSIHVYKRCMENISKLRKSEVQHMIDELKNDLKSIQKYSLDNFPEKGWIINGVRSKYGLKKYSYKKSDFAYEYRKNVNILYNPSEIAFRRSMVNELKVNADWKKTFDVMPLIKQLQIPVFYLYGKYDHLYKSPSLAKMIKTKFGQSHVIEFNKSGHTPSVDQPKMLSSELLRIYDALLGYRNRE